MSITPDKLKAYASDLKSFADDLVIQSATGPARFGDIVADYQRRDLAALATAMHAVASGQTPQPNKFWIERTKKASKDTDGAIALLWLVLFGRADLDIQIAACDQQQAAEVRKRIKRIGTLNPWMLQWLKVDNFKITNTATESTIEIITSDAASAHGGVADVYLVNELSHITDEQFVLNLFDNIRPLPNSVTLVFTNAGHLGTWQHRMREDRRTNPHWYFSNYAKPAPWATPEAIAEAKRDAGTSNRFARLYEGQWVASEGNAIDAAELAGAVKSELSPITKAESGWSYAYGLDLGLSRNAAALVVVGKQLKTGRYRLASVRCWKPSKVGRVSINQVQAAIAEQHEKFKFKVGHRDPWQSEQLEENLRAEKVPCSKFDFTVPNLDAMARHVLGLFADGMVELFNHLQLLAELRRAAVVERTNGKIYLKHPEVDGEHGDIATALTLALMAARDARAGGIMHQLTADDMLAADPCGWLPPMQGPLVEATRPGSLFSNSIFRRR